eukprot:Opistho-2@20810
MDCPPEAFAGPARGLVTARIKHFQEAPTPQQKQSVKEGHGAVSQRQRQQGPSNIAAIAAALEKDANEKRQLKGGADARSTLSLPTPEEADRQAVATAPRAPSTATAAGTLTPPRTRGLLRRETSGDKASTAAQQEDGEKPGVNPASTPGINKPSGKRKRTDAEGAGDGATTRLSESVRSGARVVQSAVALADIIRANAPAVGVDTRTAGPDKDTCDEDARARRTKYARKMHMAGLRSRGLGEPGDGDGV